MDKDFYVGERVYVPGEDRHGIVGRVDRTVLLAIRQEDGTTLTRHESLVIHEPQERPAQVQVQDEAAPVVEETDTKLPMSCVGCGTRIDTKLFGFKTNAYSTHQRQLIPLCRDCGGRIAATLVLAWNKE